MRAPTWYLYLLTLLVPSLALSEEAKATVRQQRNVYTLENAHMVIEVDSAAGARIQSWRLKPSGRDLIALWKGANEIGGALDDRAYFTSARYRGAIMRPGPESAALRTEAIHPSGLKVVKIMSLRKDTPFLDVHTTYENGTQADRRVFIRNFFLPGQHPQTSDHLYWVNGLPERGRKKEPLVASPSANAYYAPLSPPFAALWDRGTGDGIMAIAPGWEKFYFWRGSKEFPTFEWLYSKLPPGQVLRSNVRLVVVTDEEEAPDWQAMAESHTKQVRTIRISPLAGWEDEATKFGVTEAERAQGFWLSTGADEAKQRLSTPLSLDLPAESSRYLCITLNVLRDFKAPVQLQIPDELMANVLPTWETHGKDRRELLPLPSQPWAFHSGSRENLWLRVNNAGCAAGEQEIPLTLRVGDATAAWTVRLRVWPVTADTPRPFHIRGYCGGFPVWTGGYEVTEEKLQRLEAILRTYAEMGGDTLDWNAVWYKIAAKTRIAGTDRSLGQVAKSNPQAIDLDNLPKLDFSYFDDWFDLAKQHGVTRVETYMIPLASSKWQWVFLDAFVGKGRVRYDTPEATKVIVWFYVEMRRYFESKGLTGFFCKISDEISPDFIPEYQRTAKVARASGWRPFTTITGLIARTASHIEAMNPFCELWQLSFGLKDDFLDRLERKYVLGERRIELAGKWGPYGNGGAQNCWSMLAFGEDSATGLDPRAIEELRLLENGKPIRVLGNSPWGKKAPGTAYTAGSIGKYLYVVPSDGKQADEHRYEIVASMREEAPNGKPLVAIDPTDEVWCYGGGSRPFRGSYHRGWIYPVTTLYHGFRGYGLWAFFHWNPTEKIMWIEDDTCRVTISPAYCGYRDGWADTRLFHQLAAKHGREALDQIVGDAPDAAIQIGFRSREVYRYRLPLNAASPDARNEARRRALELLAQ